MLRPYPRSESSSCVLILAVTAVILLATSTCGQAALTTSLIGPEVALYGSPVVFKCSWLSDDLVFRIFWRIQPAFQTGLSTEDLEYTIKNSIREEPVPLAAGPNSPIQGEVAVDSRNNFSTLTIRSVGIAAEGNYSCSVSSVSAEKQLTRALRVIALPDQIITRLNLTSNSSTFLADGAHIGPYIEGTSFELNCFVARSRPPATIRWYRKDTLGQLFSLDTQSGPQKQQMDPSGSWRVNRSVYFRLDSRQLMGNLLICQAENEATTVTQPVQLSYRVDMLVPPTNITMSGEIQMREGVSYNLTCEALNAKPFAAVTWTLDREPVTRFVKNETIPSSDGTFTTRSVFVYTVNPSDNGKALSCIATQEVLTIQRRGLAATRMLNIYYSPRNVMTSKTQLSVVESLRSDTDSTGGINCTADANPPAQYIWTFGTDVISPGATLVFGHNLTRQDAGEYVCCAFNDLGQTNISLLLDVQYRPYCTRCVNASDPCLIGAALGQSPRITCEMTANPATDLAYTWNVNATEDPRSDSSLSPDSSSSLDLTTQSINYTVQTSSDYHRLQCGARNNIGTASQACHYRIVPAGPPHRPENCSVITVMSGGFSLKCLPGFDGGHPQKFLLAVWLTGQGTQDGLPPTTKSLSSSSTRSQSIIEPDMHESMYPEWLEKGLLAGREYRLKIMARNEAGSSPPVFLIVKTLRVEDAPTALSTTVIAAIAGSLGGFAFLLLVGCVVFLCIRRRKKGESGTGSETHSNSSGVSSGGSKSELVKEAGAAPNNGRHPDMASAKDPDAPKLANLRFQQHTAIKPDRPAPELTYTRACDLQSRKPSAKPILAPKPPVIPMNGRSADRTQYAVIDVTKAGKRPAPRPDDQPHLPNPSNHSPTLPRSNGAILQDSTHGVIKTVAVV